MKRKTEIPLWAPSRRDFLKASSLMLAEMSLFGAPSAASATESTAAKGAPNILLILNDQERYLDSLPPGYRLPGKERLQETGTEYTNQQISSCVCTSSRSNIYTGQHIQQTKMFDNLNFPWVENLSTDIPSIGHMMRDLGYYSAYQGKFHLNREFEENTDPPQLIGRELMNEYGFSDYTGIGDSIGMTLGGYLNDAWIAAFTARWLRTRGQQLNAEGKPWFLAVNFVNPHDAMFFNTDKPGEKVHDDGSFLSSLRRAPNYGLYKQEWDVELPVSRKQPWHLNDRPSAHFDFQNSRAGLVGQFPNEDDRWQRLINYYMNCIQDVDRHILSVLDEVKDLGMQNTIVMRTADHGELAGAHGMHGKGSNTYREQNHVPMHVVHPDVKGGQTSNALTSHIDIVPTLVSMSGGDEFKKADILAKLKGKDFSKVLNDPQGAGVNDVRDATLYNFNMLVYEDPDFTLGVVKLLQEHGKEKGAEEVKKQGLKPDFINHRGAIRSVFDGRYKFSRYFSTLQHNRPDTMKELLEANEIELYDHENDPHEIINLASDKEKNKELIMAMSSKLNAIIDDEVGVDDGSSIGLDANTNYAFTEADV